VGGSRGLGRAAAAGTQAVTTPALAARGVTVRFGGLTAVDRVDLEIAGRTLVGIIGPNGAGKTTFFNALSGLVRPTAGRLLVDGRDLTGAAPHAFARAGVARTFQTPRVFRDMTVARSVRFGLEFAGRRRRGELARLGDVPAILEFIGLGDEAALPVHAITPARQRLLEIGMALGTRPRVLLLDEVAAGLNDSEVLAMARLIRRCRDELGLAVVWIEHAVAILLRAVERVVVMHQGRTLADGPPDDVARDRAVIEAYLGEPAGAGGNGP
jgi:branched-chain amino acid transport system ATP-binding protein